jgi:hypothetical protein
MTRLPAPEAPVFHPTLHDVNSMTFVEYVERVVEKSKAFREAGICRIVAPDGWAPRKTGYNRLNFELPRPIRQHATGRAGLYRTLLVESKVRADGCCLMRRIGVCTACWMLVLPLALPKVPNASHPAPVAMLCPAI